MTTRAHMATRLALSPSSTTKTFVIETHSDDPREMLVDMAGSKNIEDTADAYLFRMHIPQGVVWVDQLDERFWSMHTDLAVKDASRFLHPLIEHRRDLDWVWLPSDHLRNVWPHSISRRVRTSFTGSRFVDDSSPAQDLKVQLSGRDADSLLDVISQDPRYRSAVSFDSIQASVTDPDFGMIEEAVNRMGRFAVSGDSFELHVQFVQEVVRRYSNLVRLCEAQAIHFESFDERDTAGGGTMHGHPILIRFSRNVSDLKGFVSTLLSSRQPFRLWGVPEGDGKYVQANAVDLHVGQVLPLEFGPDWMRVHLRAGSCGNTVARLITNLQHSFDGALHLEDPTLNRALHSHESKRN